MSIEQRELFRFVSKLLFSTLRGEIKWQKQQNLPEFSGTPYLPKEERNDPLCYCYPTPDEKNLWFFVYPRSKNCWLELRNHESRLELMIDMQNYGSLSDLYQAIYEKEHEGDPNAAKKTIELILNGSKQQ